jgi:predicted  nucleic acid-binding Zn-ribbon protein
MLQSIRNLSDNSSDAALTRARNQDRKASAGMVAYINQLENAEQTYTESQQKTEDEIAELRFQRNKLDEMLSDKAGVYHEIGTYISRTRARIQKAREFLQLED